MNYSRITSAKRCVTTLALAGLLIAGSLGAAEVKQKPETGKPAPDRMVTYKHASDVDLKLHVFEPENLKPGDNRGAIVFFFGGGWNGGTPSQFYMHCRELADLGMVAMAADYRVKSRNGTTPFECVADGKSAVRYIRQHAKELGIDPNRIVSGGGSAGGHVAACTGTVKKFNEPSEDAEISSVPNAMVLFNPVADTSKKGYGNAALKERFMEISPVEHISKDTPPTIIFHGTGDTTVPFENVERFDERMKELDNRCDLVAYEGRAHGFFNFGRGDNSDYNDSVKKMIAFLKSLKLID